MTDSEFNRRCNEIRHLNEIIAIKYSEIEKTGKCKIPNNYITLLKATRNRFDKEIKKRILDRYGLNEESLLLNSH